MKNRLFSRISACFNHTPTESHNQNHTSEHGRTMVEMLGVLTIMGLLTIVGIFGYSKAMKKASLDKQAQQVHDLTSSMIAFLASTSKENFATSALMTSIFVQLGYMPDSLTPSSAGSTTYLDQFGNKLSMRIDGSDYIIISWIFTTPEQFINIAQTLQRFSADLAYFRCAGRYWVGDRLCKNNDPSPCMAPITLSGWQTYSENYPTGSTLEIWFYRRQ